MTQFRIVLSTCAAQEQAEALAHALVEARAAACVNVLPGVRSIYRWQGRVESSAEVLLVIKTDTACLPAVQELISRLSGYQVPEFLVLSVDSGSDSYLAWLAESLRE